jgi:hypothetical protein
MNNIPENILQQVADAAFENAQLTWGHASPARRAVIQHALDNPAFAPFLAAEVIARAEKAEAELAAIKSSLPDAEATPPAEPAAQVPLGPEDCPPGSVVRCDTDHWFQVLYASPIGVCINNVGLPVQYRWTELAERWQINTSIPDTGRWDKDAWRACSKPGKEVAK